MLELQGRVRVPFLDHPLEQADVQIEAPPALRSKFVLFHLGA